MSELAMTIDRDEIWQRFRDWTKEGHVPTLLDQTARLMRGHTDPYYGPIDLRYAAFVAQYGWSGVLQVLADLQRDRDAVR